VALSLTLGRWRVRRCRRSDVQVLEVWNLSLPDGLFWERVGVPRVDALRGAGLGDAGIAEELAESLAGALWLLHARLHVDRGFLGGGLLEIDGFEDAVRAEDLPFPVVFSPDRVFVAERGGFELLREERGAAGAVVDVGQTAIKGSREGTRIVRPRDFGELPLELIDPSGRKPAPSAVRRERAAELIAGAVLDLSAPGPGAPGLVLALPCPVDDDLVPGACTYGWEDDRDLLPEVFRRIESGLGPGPGGSDREALVLNDAELAAESARAVVRPPDGERLLCLTLGFGPGAALLAPGVRS
jgi:hypothetical protein